MITWIDKKSYNDVTVIIPTLNEGRSIGDLLSSIVALYPEVHCLVADDGSIDRTKEVVLGLHKGNPNVMLLDRSKEPVKGLTASARDGIYCCKTPYFVVMDGDTQHPPEYIRECVANLVMGSDFCI